MLVIKNIHHRQNPHNWAVFIWKDFLAENLAVYWIINPSQQHFTMESWYNLEQRSTDGNHVRRLLCPTPWVIYHSLMSHPLPVLGPCRLFAREVSIEGSKVQADQWWKSLPAMGALVRGEEPHLTVAVSPMSPALWTFSYLTKEPSSDSLELPAFSGPVIGVNVFRTCTGLSWKGGVLSWRVLSNMIISWAHRQGLFLLDCIPQSTGNVLMLLLVFLM